MDLYISDVEVDPFKLPSSVREQSSSYVLSVYQRPYFPLLKLQMLQKKRTRRASWLYASYQITLTTLKGMVVGRWWDRRVANNVKRFQKSTLEDSAYIGRKGFEEEFINNRPTLYQQWLVRNCYLERSTDKKAQQGANRSRGGVARKARSNYIWSRRQINQGDTDIRCAWR